MTKKAEPDTEPKRKIGRPSLKTPELVAEAEKKASIYLLLDPETKRVRYVGKANDPAKRLAGHIRDARTRNRPVCNWVAKLVAKGLEPVMKVLFHDVDDWKRYETQTIKALREQGYDLLNLAKGGDDIWQSEKNRAASSKRISSYNRTGCVGKPKAETRESIIKYTYSRILKIAVKHQWTDRVETVLSKMRERANEQPEHFGAWKDIGLSDANTSNSA